MKPDRFPSIVPFNWDNPPGTAVFPTARPLPPEADDQPASTIHEP